jgi:hypothetical protein
MTHEKINGIQIGNVISYDNNEWIVMRLIIDHTVLLQKVDEPAAFIRVHVSKLLV